jgi:gallate decarboxylase subunit D
MVEYELTKGEGRARVNVTVHSMGSDLVVRIYNQNAHIGAVAIGDYDYEHERASVSVITRLGHKDDALAGEAAYLLSKSIRRPVCVIAGVHLDNITREEIDNILASTKIAISEIINVCSQQKRVN